MCLCLIKYAQINVDAGMILSHLHKNKRPRGLYGLLELKNQYRNFVSKVLDRMLP